LVAILLVHQVDRLLADDAGHRAVAPDQGDALADEDLRIPAADHVEPAEAVVIDVDQHHADLVDVAGEHHPGTIARTALAEDGRVGVAGDVDGDGVGEGGGFAPDAGGGPLEPRGAGGIEEPGEEGEGIVGHAGKVGPPAGRRKRARSPAGGGPGIFGAMRSRLVDTLASIWTWSVLAVCTALYFPPILVWRILGWP